MSRNKSEFILASILTIVILYIGINILPFILIVLPANLIVLGLRQGFLPAIGSMGLSLAIVSSLWGLEAGVLLAFLSLVALPIIGSVRRGMGPTETIVRASLVLTLVVLGLLLFATRSYEGDLLHDIESSAMASLDHSLDVFKEMGLFSQAGVDEQVFRSAYKSSLELTLIALPAIGLVFSFLMSLVNYYTSSYLLRKYKSGLAMGSFRFFSLPQDFNRGIAYGLVAIIILSLAKFQYQDELIINLGLVLTSLYTIQGISVVIDIVGMKSMTLAIVLIVMLFATGLSFLLAIIGILEGAFRIRLMWRKKNE